MKNCIVCPISLILSRSLVSSITFSDFIILLWLLVCFKLFLFSLCHEFFLLLSFFYYCCLSSSLPYNLFSCEGTISSINRITLYMYTSLYVYILLFTHTRAQKTFQLHTFAAKYTNLSLELSCNYLFYNYTH